MEQIQQTQELNQFQQAALEQAEKQLESLKQEISTKKYLVDMKKSDIELLLQFIITDAPWKFTECLGIKEVEKELKQCIKSGKLFTGAIVIEASYYYLSKVEGKGNSTNTETFSHMEDYLRVLKAITNAIERIKMDSEKVREAEFIVAARREGIEPDSSMNQPEETK